MMCIKHPGSMITVFKQVGVFVDSFEAKNRCFPRTILKVFSVYNQTYAQYDKDDFL